MSEINQTIKAKQKRVKKIESFKRDEEWPPSPPLATPLNRDVNTNKLPCQYGKRNEIKREGISRLKIYVR